MDAFTGYIYQFLLNWAITLAIETPVFFFLMRRYYKVAKENVSTARLVWGGIFASTITIPWVWFVFPFLITHSLVLALVAGEFVAYGFETVFYRTMFQMSWKQAFVISFIANSASLFLGYWPNLFIRFY